MPTKICPLVKGTPSNQLLCCDRVSCSLNKSPDLICPDSNTIANCQPISELTACQRTDNAAQTVCQNHPGKSYCLWMDQSNPLNKPSETYFTGGNLDYGQTWKLRQGRSWALSRHEINESTDGATACCDSTQDGCQFCSGATSPDVKCGDLFLPPNTQGNCSFTYLNSTDSTSHTLNQVYRGEVCDVGGSSSSSSPSNTPASNSFSFGGKKSGASGGGGAMGIIFAVISVVTTISSLFIGIRRLRVAYKSYQVRKSKESGGSKNKNKSNEEAIELVELSPEENKQKGD